MERIITVTVLLLLVVGSIAFAGNLEPVSYELAVDIDPSGGAIDVVGEIIVRRSPNDTEPIELRLHDAFTVRELQVNGHSTLHTFEAGSASRLQPTAKRLVIDVPENEAFAECFALVAVERIRGHEAYERGLVRTRAAVATLDGSAPSLAEVPMSNDGDGYTIRYFKGALLVHALREALGDDAFFVACREFYALFRAPGASTKDFRTFWRRRLGDDGPWLDRWLDTPGGELPVRASDAAGQP